MTDVECSCVDEGVPISDTVLDSVSDAELLKLFVDDTLADLEGVAMDRENDPELVAVVEGCADGDGEFGRVADVVWFREPEEETDKDAVSDKLWVTDGG